MRANRPETTKNWEETMKKFLGGLAGVTMAFAFASPAHAQDTIKIGIIMPYSGQFADTGTRWTTASSST